MKSEDEYPNIIWQGRVHLGDEPGYYADAFFAGLCFEMPVELIPYSGAYESQGQVRLMLSAEGIRSNQGYPGHTVAVVPHLIKRDESGSWYVGSSLADGRLDADSDGQLSLLIDGMIPRYVVVRVRADVTVAPGLYHETVVSRLALASRTHYAYSGFRVRDMDRLSAEAV
jgi:hypothetical protein